MVSAAKMTADTKRLNAAIPFNNWATALCPEAVACEELDVASWPEKNLIICTTSDKGLCGASPPVSTGSELCRTAHQTSQIS